MVLGDFRDFLKNDRTPFFEVKRRVNEGNFAQNQFFHGKFHVPLRKKITPKMSKFLSFKLKKMPFLTILGSKS